MTSRSFVTLCIGGKTIARFRRQLSPESSVLLQQELLSTLQLMVDGMIWSNPVTGEAECLGGVLRGLKDGRPGRELLPFPLLSRLSSYLLPSTLAEYEPDDELLADKYVRNGDWIPSGFLYRQWSTGTRSGERDRSPPADLEQRALQRALSRDFPEATVDIAQCKFEWPHRFTNIAGDKQLRIRSGDHVRMSVSDGQVIVVRIDKMTVVILPDSRRVPYVFASWYSIVGTHPLIGVELIRSQTDVKLPILLSRVCEPVMVVHKCKRQCSDRKKCPAETCNHICRVVNACEQHQQPACTDAACLKKPFFPTMVHFDRNTAWMVFDHESGFVPDSTPHRLGSLGVDLPTATTSQAALEFN